MFNLIQAKSEMMDMSEYAVLSDEESVMHFSSDIPDKYRFEMIYDGKSDIPLEGDLSDIGEFAEDVWIQAILDGLACYVLIKTDSIHFMRVYA